MGNLEEVVSHLEQGDLDLEEAIKKYESGHRSLKKCYQILESAQKRIEVLTGSLSGEKKTGARETGSGSSAAQWKSVDLSVDSHPEDSEEDLDNLDSTGR